MHMNTIHKALSYLVRFDFAKIGAAIADRIPAWLYRRNVAYIYQLQIEAVAADSDKSEMSLPEGYCFRKAASDDLAACAEMARLPAAEYSRRHRAGDLLYGIFAQQTPINLNWLHFGPCYVRGLAYQFDTEPSNCYIYGVVTSPDYRSRGFYKSAQRELIRVVRLHGSRRIIQVAMTGNAAVLATLPKFGYKIVGVLCHRTLFGVKWTTIRDCRGRKLSRQWRIGNPSDEVFQI